MKEARRPRGRIIKNKGIWYVAYDVPDSSKKYGYTQKTKSTGIEVGTKPREMKRNEELASKFRDEYMESIFPMESKREQKDGGGQVSVADYLRTWFPSRRLEVESNTLGSQKGQLYSRILPYFDEYPVLLSEIGPEHIIQYREYAEKTWKVGKNTINKLVSIISVALDAAIERQLIHQNPCKVVPGLKIFRPPIDYYSPEELELFLQAIKGELFEPIFLVAAYYGLRRSELLGLKWQNVVLNGREPRITIKHVVVIQNDWSGHREIKGKNRTKNKKSLRSLPLFPLVKEALQALRQEQDERKRLLGSAYDYTNEDYIFVDEMGALLNPDRVSRHFTRIVRKAGLRDLPLKNMRHSCATLQLNNGVTIQDIAAWLGHSDTRMVQNTYDHLEVEYSAQKTASVISSILDGDRVGSL